MKRAYVPISVVSIISCLSLASPGFAQSGACCIAGIGGNFCSVTGPSECVLGVYQGDGTNCATAACLGSPRGACCNIDNSLCILTDGGLAACDGFWALTSIYHGDGTTCIETPGGMYDDCPQLAQSGACCIAGIGGNFCSVTGPSECVLGVYQGDGTNCATAACLGSPRGACCNIDNSLCILTDGGLAACDTFWALTSIYHGDGTTCIETPGGMYDDCPQPAPSGAVPTVSQWGIAIMGLLLLMGGKVYFNRRRAMQA